MSSNPLCHNPLWRKPLWPQTLVHQPPYTACRCSSRAEGSDRRLGSRALPGGGGGHPNRAGEEACRLDPDCRPRGRAGDVHRDAAGLAARLCAAHSSWACTLPVRHLPGVCHLPRLCQRSGLTLPKPWYLQDCTLLVTVQGESLVGTSRCSGLGCASCRVEAAQSASRQTFVCAVIELSYQVVCMHSVQQPLCILVDCS